MSNNPQVILDTFHRYAETFEHLKPAQVLPFYHYPALLIAPGKAVAIKNWVEGFIAFWVVMEGLRRRGYGHSHTDSLSVRYISHDLALVSGVVIRYKRDKTELERFGLTYTLRQVSGGNWKIISGALHDVSV